jgi:Fe-S-cluster containining protein
MSDRLPVSEYESVDVLLRVGASPLRIQAQMPRDPMSLPDLLPLVQSLTDALVAAAVREAEQMGRRVSCGPGCGACCRQLVPVSEIEVLYLQDLLNGLSSSHRARIEQRIGRARSRLSNAGLLDELRTASHLDSREARRSLGYRYFRLGIPCPFLEEESCSIHPQRPLACREYLVTSPPATCAELERGEAQTLELPRRPSAILNRFGDGIGASPPRWAPLTLFLERSRDCEARIRQRTHAGPLFLERFLRKLANTAEKPTVSPDTQDP